MVRISHENTKVCLADCLKVISEFDSIENYLVTVFNQPSQCYEIIGKVDEILSDSQNYKIDVKYISQVKIKFRECQQKTDLKVYEIALQEYSIAIMNGEIKSGNG